MDSLLSNAVTSIQLGVEDYQSNDARRILSAVRNLTAGILLLFKERLRQLSPVGSEDALIKRDVRPVLIGGKVLFHGVGVKTVDVHQIEERCKALRIDADWPRFRALTTIRNEIEHYCANTPRARIRELMADAFIILRDFIVKELRNEPVDLLGGETWAQLLDVGTVYEHELEECQKAMEQIRWESIELEQISHHLRCAHCNSELLKPTKSRNGYASLHEFRCSSCGLESSFDELIEEAVQEHFAADHYRAMTDGGEISTAPCHECGKETFLLDHGHCVACGAKLKYHACAVCNATLGPDDQSGRGLCGYHRWIAEKDD
jgi:hypothetical protein